jgi:hypothetical protein
MVVIISAWRDFLICGLCSNQFYRGSQVEQHHTTLPNCVPPEPDDPDEPDVDPDEPDVDIPDEPDVDPDEPDVDIPDEPEPPNNPRPTSSSSSDGSEGAGKGELYFNLLNI